MSDHMIGPKALARTFFQRLMRGAENVIQSANQNHQNEH
jgi:hypothetical protein